MTEVEEPNSESLSIPQRPEREGPSPHTLFPRGRANIGGCEAKEQNHLIEFDEPPPPTPVPVRNGWAGGGDTGLGAWVAPSGE